MTTRYCLSARARGTSLDTPLARPCPPQCTSGFTWHIFTCPTKEMLSKEIKFSPSFPCQLDLRAPAPLHGGGDTSKHQGPLHHSPRFTSVPDPTVCWTHSSSPYTAAGPWELPCCGSQGKGQQTKENSSPQLHQLTAPELRLHQLTIL